MVVVELNEWFTNTHLIGGGI